MERQTLAAVLEAPGRIVAREIPMPRVGPDEVLIAVHACGVCGSDLRYFAGGNPWAIHTLGTSKPNPPNMVLGHEIAGTIREVGEGVDPGRVGERVVALAFRTCGRCPDCLRGNSHLCANTEHLGHGAGWESLEFNPGGMSQYMTLWADKAIALPEGISFEEATMLDGLGVAVHAVDRTALRRGDGVLILGSGPIGLCIAQVAKARGAQPVICSDVYPKALELARELGADHVVDGRTEEAATVAREVTGGRGVDAVFESTGSAAVQMAAVSALAPGGTCVFMAGVAEGVALSTRLLAGERSVTTAANFADGDIEEAIRLVASGEVRVQPMITHRFALRDVADAFALLAEKRASDAFKAIIVP